MGVSTSVDIVIAILAGGRSRRMGHDKLRLELNGRTLLDRTIDTAAATGRPVLVVGRAAPEASTSTATYLDDSVPGAGPLAGLCTALGYANPAAVLALASDLPLLEVGGVEWLINCALNAMETDGLAVRNGAMLEPLFSVYTQRTADTAQARMADGRRSLHGLVEDGDFAVIDAPGWVAAQLFNINEPADWDRVSAMHRGEPV